MRRLLIGVCLLTALGALALQVRAEPIWTSVGPGGGGWIQSIAASPFRENRILLGGDIQGVFTSDDAGNTWAVHNEGLRDFWIDAILYHPVDPDIVHAGGPSGVYKSTDGGNSWRWLRTGFPAVSANGWSAPVSSLAMDPANPDAIYAGIGTPRSGAGKQGAVYKSTDAGSTWSRANAAGSLPADALITSLAFLPTNRTSAPGSSTPLYLTSQYGFFESRDGGVTWTASNSGLPHTNVARLAISRSRPEVMYVTLYTPSAAPWRGGVYRSDDGGRTWGARNTGLQQLMGANDTLTSNYRELVIDPNDSQTVFLGTTDYVSHTVFKTTDGGANWTPALTKPQTSNVADGWIDFIGHTVQCLTISPLNPRLVYFATSAAVLRTSDGGQTWQQTYSKRSGDGYQTTGLEITGLFSIVVDPRNPPRLFFGYGDVGLFVSENGGSSVQRRMTGIPRASANTAYTVALDPANAQHLWGSFGPREAGTSGFFAPGFMVAESTDGGRNWTARRDGLPDRAVKRLLLDESGSSRRLLATVVANGIYASDDGGRSWTSSSSGLAHGDVRDLVPHASLPGTYWAVLGGSGSTPGGVYRSDNRGATWQRLSTASFEGYDIKQLAVSRNLYIAARRAAVGGRVYPGGIFASEDGGLTWRLILDDPFAQAVAVDPRDPRVIFAGLTDHPFHDDSRGNGLKVSRDGGVTWTSVTGLPNGRIAVLALHPTNSNRLYVGTTGNGVVVVDF